MSLRLHYATRSDVGLLREGNEDSAYAGPRLLAVADGMGGHAHGEVASAEAIATLAPLDRDTPREDLPDALERAVRKANEQLQRMVEADPTLEGMGTTLTAMLWSADGPVLAHVGDSRAYLLRAGELHRITRDHTLVQSLVDEGRIDEDEAAVHPQRSLLLRALDGRGEVEPDIFTQDTQLGDRYLLCSDGLSGVVSEDTLQEALDSDAEPDRTVAHLVELANRGGGPDNITCVVADVVETHGGEDTGRAPAAPIVAGAAAHTLNSDDTAPLDTSAARAAALMRAPSGASGEQRGGGAASSESPRRRLATILPRRRLSRAVLVVLVIAVAIGGLGSVGWSYARSQYYVGAHDGEVVIFRGLSQQVAGRELSRVHTRTRLSLRELPRFERHAVMSDIQASSLAGAEAVVHRLRVEARACSSERGSRGQPPAPGRRDIGRQGEPRTPGGVIGAPTRSPVTDAPARSAGQPSPRASPDTPPRGCIEEVSNR